ncbi:CynX/NimT family MFS transporter [Agromyces soli]|uniref:MFS transporter n=1 Tax=Agromyces soli TaxID=659012 RepID=A0ABY4AS89_9MICO|nr:MFS transporter [Agromyces soli]UOE25865.1 MFS transporter [Agromyces soli]
MAPAGPPSPRAPWRGRLLALLGIVLVAFNLRTAVAALSPVLGRVAEDIALSPAFIGFLGMLPPLCYAAFGILTPLVARRFGLERTLVASLVLLTAGLAWRGLAADGVQLVVASVATFAAMGVGNVLLPPLVKRYFPARIGLMTTVYVTAMSVSTLVPPLLAEPVAEAAGWRVSVGEWAVVAAVALVPWALLLARPAAGVDSQPEEPQPGLLARAARSPLGWALLVVFAVAGFNAYSAFAWLPEILHDIAGTAPAESGALLSLYAAMGIPAGLFVPVLAVRFGRIRLLVWFAVLVFVCGYLGLLLAPGQASWLWVALVGCGPMLFPLSLVLINLRTRSHEGAVALSGFVQSAGYLVVAVGPLVVGLLHEASGGWTWPLLLLLVSTLPAAVAGAVVARPRYLEDERR